MRSLSPEPDHPWPLWIGGYDAGNGGPLAEVVSPLDGGVVARVHQATEADVDRALALGGQAWQVARSTPKHERAAWLMDAAQRLDEVVGPLTESLIALIGKPHRLAQVEAKRGSDLLRRCAAELSSITGETLPLDAVPGGDGLLGMTWREPLGIVAAITPFNAPINLMMQKVAPALAMGNAVIVKPSPETAVVTLQVVEAIAPAFPAGLINVVCGGADIGEYLVSRREVAGVSLTGGVAAGRAVMRAAGIKPVLLELGSNAPNIVLADATIDDAARRIAQASFGASGQQCISAQRILVEQSVVEPFLESYVEAARGMNVGDPRLKDTDIGPMVHERARDRVVGLIDDAVAKGGRLELDGRTDGLYLRPTIVVDPRDDARILTEEAFGPVTVVVSVEDVAHAVQVANSIDLGLQAACFTNDISQAIHVARELRTGSVWINEASRFRLDTYPFGGVGDSGTGREGVRYAMEELSYVKFVGVRPSPGPVTTGARHD
jgi:acyl-CoA reductase-like NAD-dependent aldehyde dehydrogenase